MYEKWGGGRVAEWQRSTPIGQNRLIIMVFFSDNVVPTDQDPSRIARSPYQYQCQEVAGPVMTRTGEGYTLTLDERMVVYSLALD